MLGILYCTPLCDTSCLNVREYPFHTVTEFCLPMLAHLLRQKYLDFFVSKDHLVMPGAPLIPIDALGNLDTSTLFTSAGDFPIYATTLNGDDVREINFPKAGFIIIGSEGKGIGDEIISFAQKKISIPSFSKAESLNAAVAAGIICYELRK